MELNEYQQKAMTTCMESCDNFAYMKDNLVAEVGEFSGKIAKAKRRNQISFDAEGDLLFNFETTEETLEFDRELMKEAGDILWQLSGLCHVMGWSLEYVAVENLEKLAARKKAGTIDGDGDGIIR